MVKTETVILIGAAAVGAVILLAPRAEADDRGGAAPNIFSFLQGADIVPQFGDIFSGLGAAIGESVSGIGGIVSQPVTALSSGLSDIIATFGEQGENIGDILASPFDAINDIFSGIGESVGNFTANISESIEGFPSFTTDVFQAFSFPITAPAETIAQGITTAIGTLTGGVQAGVKTVQTPFGPLSTPIFVPSAALAAAAPGVSTMIRETVDRFTSSPITRIGRPSLIRDIPLPSFLPAGISPDIIKKRFAAGLSVAGISAAQAKAGGLI